VRGIGLKVSLVPRLFESVNVHVSLEHLGGLPLLGLHTVDPKGWHFVVKDVVDRVAAAVALLLLAAARRLGARGAVVLPGPDPVPPAAHRSRRARLRAAQVPFYAAGGGRRGPPKLVALGPDVAPGGVEGADRRTAVGRLMRRTSMGRLPQLAERDRGEMSLVGPRPERPEFVDLFGTRIARYEDRHRVKSGITGWAQVHGLRGQTSLADRVEWDNHYIENWSLGLDVKILVMTVAAVLRRAE
jgi:hypothetical protein